MRSQVQVLAGPPPIPAGHSAVGSEPGAPAASLGRAGAAPPIPAGTPSALPGPSTRAAASTTTTHRGRHHHEDGSHAAGAATSRCGLLPCLAQPPATGRSARRPGLPGRPGSSAAAACTRPGRVRQRQPRRPCATPTRQPIGTSTRSRGAGCLAASACPRTPRLMGTRRTRPDGRGGHQTAGHQTPDVGQVDSRWSDRRIPDDEPRRLDTGRAGHRTGRPPDGRTPDGADSQAPDDGPDRWTPHAGRGPATDAIDGVLAWSTTATVPARWTLHWADASGRATSQDSAAARTTRAITLLRTGLTTATTGSCSVAPPVPKPRLGALLSSDDCGSSVERDAAGQVLWQVPMWRLVRVLSGGPVVDLGAVYVLTC
jgi:hypothetical protein